MIMNPTLSQVVTKGTLSLLWLGTTVIRCLLCVGACVFLSLGENANVLGTIPPENFIKQISVCVNNDTLCTLNK